jgi:Domain of unknown function (DUF4157)
LYEREKAEATRSGTDRGSARAPRGAPRPQPRGRLGLPVTAGNAAVVEVLRRAGHPGTEGQRQDGPVLGHQHTEQAATPAVQRSDTVHAVLRTPGQPLDEATRTDMEARLGADFSDVRVHTDAAARASAAEVGAHAYTSGSHVVVGEGGGDRHTLAHELTHVIQQRRGPVAGTDDGNGLKVSDPSDRFEREAEANATRVLSGPAPVPREASGRASSVSAGDAARPGHVQRMNAGGTPTPTYRIAVRAARAAEGAQPIGETQNQRHLYVVISHLEALLQGELGEPTCTVALNGMATADALDLARDRLNTLQHKPTGAFNARQRAVPVPAYSGIVFADSEDIRRIADRHKLHTGHRGAFADLNRPNDTTGLGMYDKLQRGDWVQIVNDDNLLYVGPPKTRGPRAHTAAPTSAALPSVPSSFSDPNISISGNVLTSMTTMNGPCRKGSRSPGQAAVMGGHSALNYARSVGLTDAGNMTWEWLHLVGSALGGMNVRGNLVAGTFDSNTQMTMLENRIAKYCATRVTPAQPATYTVRAALHQTNNALTWVATEIEALFEHGSETIHGTFEARSPAAVDQLAYDYYDFLFGVQGGTVTEYLERLFSQDE